MDNTDTRRYRRKSDGTVYRVVMQARSLFGSVILRAIEGPGEVTTTNDRLALDYEFFRVGENAPDRVAARERSREEISADLTAMTAAVHEYFAADAALDEAFANVRFAAPDMARQMAEEHSRAIVRAQTARRALREMAGMKR